MEIKRLQDQLEYEKKMKLEFDRKLKEQEL